ncbi:WG repeat-containing protein [Psychrobacter okhotskensis]|uniref:WG repeat-containing protein n=1 Tax=Psychrobacter okhotskensis TaxID=212403 RepID=UPI003D03A781
MKALGLCTLLAFLIGCTAADVTTDSWGAQTHSAITSVMPSSSSDSTRGVSPDLPVEYHSSIEGHDDTCGFKNSAGNVITPAIYDHCGEFHDGMAYVTHGYDTIGYVDIQGKVAIPVIYPIFFDFVPEIHNFSEGRVAVYKDDKWGFIDKQGKLVIPYVYRYVGDFSNGLVTVLRNEKFGAIDSNGDTVIDFRYQQLGNFKEGLANFRLTDDSRLGYINTKGKTVIAHTWDAGLDFSEGLAAVGVEDYDQLKWGFIDHAGRVVIEPKYNAASPDVGDLSLYTDVSDGYFINGLATMYLEGDQITQVIIDKQGNEIKRQTYDSYDKFFDNSDF